MSSTPCDRHVRGDLGRSRRADSALFPWREDAATRGTIIGLRPNHRLAHMWRALLEGFGYAFRHHREVVNDMGHPTTRFMERDTRGSAPPMSNWRRCTAAARAL
ncbi:MAG: FGGY-family carbohydrate kinase [Alphaproteobacteria bacterium]